MYLSTIGVTFTMNEAEVEGMIDFPDFLGSSDKIEVTTQKDKQRKYVPGLLDPGDMPFTFGYEGNSPTTNWGKFKAAVGEENDYSVTFPDGSGFEWSGGHTLSMPGKGVGEAMVFTLTVAPSSDIEEIPSTAAAQASAQSAEDPEATEDPEETKA